MAQRGIKPAFTNCDRAFNRAGACVGSARARGFIPALAHSAPAYSRAGARGSSAKARGFTLLEVLVVMAIIAALLAALTLSFGGSASRRLENAARRAQALIELACDRASLSGSDMGIRVAADRLEFGFIDASGWHAIVGQDSSDPLRPRALGESVTLRLQRDGRELTLADEASGPQLACLGSGELTPFALELRVEGSDEAWQLRGDALRRFTLERIDARR